jgi:hypothetical protein
MTSYNFRMFEFLRHKFVRVVYKRENGELPSLYLNLCTSCVESE